MSEQKYQKIAERVIDKYYDKISATGKVPSHIEVTAIEFSALLRANQLERFQETFSGGVVYKIGHETIVRVINPDLDDDCATQEQRNEMIKSMEAIKK